jgi:membrane-bound serine protease (ClpP class)
VFIIIALLLALLLLPSPWGLIVIALAVVCEVSLAVFGIRYSRRRRAQVGAQTLIGDTADVITALAPTGQVMHGGEIWAAHSAQGARVGELVRITGVAGLTLEVERASVLGSS